MTIKLPHHGDAYWLDRVSVPECVVCTEGVTPDGASDALGCFSIRIEAGKISRIIRGRAPSESIAVVDCGHRLIMPCFVDVHTHLDKGHIVARSPNPDGTFFGARETVGQDRELRWSSEDVFQRMEFALRAAYAHGTCAVRTHLDSIGKQIDISWPLFDEIRREWRDRIALQAVCLLPVVSVIDAPAEFTAVVAQLRRFGGILGAVTFLGEKPNPQLDRALDRMIDVAKVEGFDLDFHVDESGSPDARSLERIADALIRHRFSGRALAGHCCSLALMEDGDRARVIGKLAEAGLSVVSLPMCNLYLQDRFSGRTPRWRGVAPLHELEAAGVSTMVSSDNTRDPFYAYGDLDMVEVFREATRILHFDHSARPWLEAITARPAKQMGLSERGILAMGSPADLVLFEARTLNEWLSRPQMDRQVIRAGSSIKDKPPAYSELDALMA